MIVKDRTVEAGRFKEFMVIVLCFIPLELRRSAFGGVKGIDHLVRVAVKSRKRKT